METELYESAPQQTDNAPITIPLEPDLRSKLEAIAQKRGLSIENLIHSLIKEELDKEG